MNDEKQPKIRFKGFEDPWEQRKLGDLVLIQSGYAPSQIHPIKNAKIPYIKVDDLNHTNRDQTYSSLFSEKHSKLKEVRRGATIFPKRGAAIMTNKIRILAQSSYMDTNMMALIPVNIDSQFLYTVILRTGLFKIADTSTIPQINNKHITPYLIGLPTILEQRFIGHFFKKIDSLIVANQSKLDQLKELKKLLMQKIFSQQWRFKGFTDPWEQRKLGEIVEINSGRDYKKLGRGKIPVFGTGGYMLSVNGKLSDRDSVGIGRKGSIDKPQFLSAPFWTVDTLFFMTPKNKNDVKFIFDLSQLIQWKKYDESTGVPSLSKSTISNIPITVTKEDEQNKVSTLFELVDKIIAANQRRLDQLKALKKYLMQNMFV
ncbi:MAG: restriction endonuclease subunit S [Lentilactobacillus diolivorans]|uniref:restriction endonuclease subunit S n=1 Tax=Lentilactobacillus diolivorans TaxID=179838 RepID=UPI0039EC1186